MNHGKQFCTFFLEHQMYGIPVEEVQEVIRGLSITQIPLAPPAVVGLINLRGKIVTAIDLGTRLGLQRKGDVAERMNVVVGGGEQPVSFLVDTIGDVVDVTEEMFEGVPDMLQGVARELITGVYKLNGGLLHALDATKSAQMAEIGTVQRQE